MNPQRRSVPRLRSAGGLRRLVLLPALAATLLAPAAPAADPIPAPAPAAKPAPAKAAPARFVIVERVLTQDQGDWQADYAFRLEAAAPVTLNPSDVSARVEGWLSNSRVPVHATPRRSAASVDGSAGSAAYAEVIAGGDELLRCRERASIRLEAAPGDSAAAAPANPARPAPHAADAAQARGRDPEPLVPVTVAPGGVLRVRLRLDHQHALYGEYDPLLGRRELDLRLGATAFRDVLPFDREQYLAQPRPAWQSEPADDRKDTRMFASGPDSFHLEADVHGHQYIRFERRVRYGTRMRLRFAYLIAAGTEGEFRARIAQYREDPNSNWKVLGDGAFDQAYKTVGRWVRVERIFRTESEATSLGLDFRITSDAEVGEVWIDDISLEPVDGAPSGP